MKKSFHVFFLFVLFAFFATAQSWAYVNNIVSVPGGKILTGYANASEGQNVILLISPDPDYVFAGLEVKEDATGNDVAVVIISDGEATYTMPASDVTVTPSWAHSVETPNYTGGTVAADKAIASKDETVTLTVSSDKGYVLQKLDLFNRATDETVELVVSDGKATFTMPEANVVVTPYWEKINYSVSVIGGGVKTDKTTATYGETVTLTIGPNDNYLFSSLEVKDVDENPVTVTLSDDKTSATFTMPASNVSVTSLWNQIYDVEIISVAGGTVTTDKERAAVGQTVSLTITPADRHVLTKLEVAKKYNNSISPKVELSDGKATFTMPNYNVVVTPFWDVNVLTEDGEGELYVNMPEIGTKTVDIPENVKSFKVYDDGGKDENHSLHAKGNLVLNAPEGYQLQVTGTVCYSYVYFYIYDGDSDAKKLFDKASAYSDFDVGTIRSSGDKLTIYFESRTRTVGYNYSGLDLTVSLVKVDFGAVSIAKADDGKIHATINGDYAGKDTLVISEAIEVDAVDYNRELEVDVPVTALLPVTLPAGTTVNAEFYTLEKVEQVEGMKWQATMKYIGDGNLPQPNTPYAVILPTGQSELKFDLPSGKKATVQTGDINKVCGVDASCKLDENGKITDDWFFTGTYAYKEWKEDDEELGLAYAFSANDNPGGAAKGKFGKIKIDENSSEYPRAKAMRCYLRKRDANVKLQQQNQAQMVAASPYVAKFSINNLPETIDVEFVKDDAKGGRTVLHGRMNTVTGEFKMLRDYDLKGRKVNSTNRARGAYYGKKVMKK